jgi:hypothetical protein
MTRPVTVHYFYKVRWGHQREWLDLFRRNHWPLLREGVREGRMLDVRLCEPRFHGDGRADWDVLVTITYRDWSVIEDHTPAELIERLFPDAERYKQEEQRRFELLEAHWDVPLEELELPD